MRINVTATAATYLLFALPGGFVLYCLTRRPLLSGVAGSVAAMAVTSILRTVLPCHYWAHANDFIIEPFVRLKCFRHPDEALFSLAFHVGIPVLVLWGISLLGKRLRGPIRQTDCQICHYNLTGNTSGVCPECGSPVPSGALDAAEVIAPTERNNHS